MDFLSHAISKSKKGNQKVVDGTISNGVIFFDYDGTIVDFWKAEDVSDKLSLPKSPVHKNLIAQEWNWSLEEIKQYVSEYPDSIVNVGQLYNTKDDAIYMEIELSEGRLEPYLGIGIEGTAKIDWGDGSEFDTISGLSVGTSKFKLHKYSKEGTYSIRIIPEEDTNFGINGYSTSNGSCSSILGRFASYNSVNSVYLNCLKTLFLSKRVTSIGKDGLNDCRTLKKVVLPIDLKELGFYAFFNCKSIETIVMPRGIENIAYQSFCGCNSLSKIALANGLKYMSSYAFAECYSLKKITFPLTMYSISDSVFSGCFCLDTIVLPNGIEALGNYSFQQCTSLQKLFLSEGLESIPTNTFGGCKNLTSVTIPKKVKRIGANGFSGCSGLGIVKFTNPIPPTVAASNVFASLPTDCVIYVPEEGLSNYLSATNYPYKGNLSYIGY